MLIRPIDEPPPPDGRKSGAPRGKKYPLLYVDLVNLAANGLDDETWGWEAETERERNLMMYSLKDYAKEIGGLTVITRRSEPKKVWVRRYE